MPAMITASVGPANLANITRPSVRRDRSLTHTTRARAPQPMMSSEEPEARAGIPA